MDVFYYCLLILFYWVWVEVWLEISYDWIDDDYWLVCFVVFFGCGMLSLWGCELLVDIVCYYYIGYFVVQICYLDGLWVIFVEYFEVLVVVEEYVG